MNADLIIGAERIERFGVEPDAERPDTATTARDFAASPDAAASDDDSGLVGVAIADDRIIAVGSLAELSAHAGPGTRTRRFPGATITAGLVDAHAHPVWGSIDRGSGVDLGAATTLDEVLDLLDAAIDARGIRDDPDAWLTGFDLDVNVFPGEPTGAAFAERFPDRPVSLMTRDAHALVLSPRAIELAGLTGDEVFDDASRIVVGADGRPTGSVLEIQAMDLVFAHYPAIPDEVAAGYVLAELRALAAQGVTGLHALDFHDPSEAVYRSIEERGELPVRVRCSPLVPADSDEETWREIARLLGRGGRRWRVEGVKFMLDGTADNGTAWFARADRHGENRLPLWRDLDAYERAVAFFAGLGAPSATHAIGDEAVRRALDVFERVGRVDAAPHRIEHLESIPDDLVDRFARAGVVASLQPVHGTRHTRADGTDNWSERLGAERAAHGWRTRDLLDHGTVVALGSDWPIGPGDPRVQLADAQLRRPVESPDIAPVQPEQAITVDEAYRGMTLGPALAVGAERSLGRVEPGYLADLTIFARDPRDLSPEEQAVNPVLATVVDGELFVHRTGEAEPPVDEGREARGDDRESRADEHREEEARR